MFVLDYIDVEGVEVSKPMVLQSAAGYYIGTLYREHGCEGPQERLSGYYQTEALASKELSNYEVSVWMTSRLDA